MILKIIRRISLFSFLCISCVPSLCTFPTKDDLQKKIQPFLDSVPVSFIKGCFPVAAGEIAGIVATSVIETVLIRYKFFALDFEFPFLSIFTSIGGIAGAFVDYRWGWGKNDKHPTVHKLGSTAALSFLAGKSYKALQGHTKKDDDNNPL